jgi:hypothetical protein
MGSQPRPAPLQRLEPPPQRIVVAGKSALTVADTAFTFSEAQERVVALVRAGERF